MPKPRIPLRVAMVAFGYFAVYCAAIVAVTKDRSRPDLFTGVAAATIGPLTTFSLMRCRGRALDYAWGHSLTYLAGLAAALLFY
jgi:hypothetical protein